MCTLIRGGSGDINYFCVVESRDWIFPVLWTLWCSRIRIFGILANSMPDERTKSNITWFNSPLRGNRKAENLLDMILVGKWHTYHAEGVKVRRPRRNPTVAFRRLNPELLEKVKHKAADHSNSDSETDSDSDKESDSPTAVAESVPSNTVVSAPAMGEEPSHSEDEEADRIRRRYHRKKRAAKTKGKKKVFPSHTTFVVDPDINLRSAGLKGLLSDELSAPKTRAAVVIGVGASSSDNQDLWEGWPPGSPATSVKQISPQGGAGKEGKSKRYRSRGLRGALRAGLSRKCEIREDKTSMHSGKERERKDEGARGWYPATSAPNLRPPQKGDGEGNEEVHTDRPLTKRSCDEEPARFRESTRSSTRPVVIAARCPEMNAKSANKARRMGKAPRVRVGAYTGSITAAATAADAGGGARAAALKRDRSVGRMCQSFVSTRTTARSSGMYRARTRTITALSLAPHLCPAPPAHPPPARPRAATYRRQSYTPRRPPSEKRAGYDLGLAMKNAPGARAGGGGVVAGAAPRTPRLMLPPPSTSYTRIAGQAVGGPRRECTRGCTRVSEGRARGARDADEGAGRPTHRAVYPPALAPRLRWVTVRTRAARTRCAPRRPSASCRGSARAGATAARMGGRERGEAASLEVCARDGLLRAEPRQHAPQAYGAGNVPVCTPYRAEWYMRMVGRGCAAARGVTEERTHGGLACRAPRASAVAACLS
ncbi:hypothetical protein FB451DRAFT_1377452 [Mycena latifolia]|nr:hypothetical protein FB451DRAFT_1377452 [Mycena latifolia]